MAYSVPGKRCLICKEILPPGNGMGRPLLYCSNKCRKKAGRITKWGKEDQELNGRTKFLLKDREDTTAKPTEWWIAQAYAIREVCQACQGPVEGVYVPPTRESDGECAVVAHCRLCGRERMVIPGRGGVPYDTRYSGMYSQPGPSHNPSHPPRVAIHVRPHKTWRAKKTMEDREFEP